MGRVFLVELEGSCFSCKYCRTQLALPQHVISKTFRCKHGRAYLFDQVKNVSVQDIPDHRFMITGRHNVVDIYCVVCGANLGWQYYYAFDQDQRFKEGKYVLEMFMVFGPDGSSYLPSLDPQLAFGNNV